MKLQHQFKYKNHYRKNWKYYLSKPVVMPFYILDSIIFFEDKNRFWDSSIWLHRILIFHDNLYNYYEPYEPNEEDGYLQ